MNPLRVLDGIFGETREQTQLLWIKIWEQPAVAVGRMFSSRLAGRASCFGTRASTILGGLKIRKSKKILAGHQTFAVEDSPAGAPDFAGDASHSH